MYITLIWPWPWNCIDKITDFCFTWIDVEQTSTASWLKLQKLIVNKCSIKGNTRQATKNSYNKAFSTCAKPVKTSDSKQRYNFERHDRVFSRGGYHALNISGLSSACKFWANSKLQKTENKSIECHLESRSIYI